MGDFAEKYDVIVLGAGHAGCEAALACARMGWPTLVLTMNLDSVALMACNPAIGGTSKGHLVREVDALGGEMGLAADDTLIQSRMLNTAKGPAVHSLRAQMDKRRYHERMKTALERQPNLSLRQGEAVEILAENGRVTGLVTSLGGTYHCRKLIVATGVYLKSRVLVGEIALESGPSGLHGANALSGSLRALGFSLLRFKTGTPARIHARSVDFTRFEIQPGDEPMVPFSFMTREIIREQTSCYLGYTNEATHRIIRENLHRSAMYSGLVEGTGARYCPSIEDKIVRFADKPRHQIFLEPEGASTQELYVQGMSSSLPEDVQQAMLRSIDGLERCELMRPAYAIEYDCIDATQLQLSLESRAVAGLYFAGQINGSSGYEEAAAQGLMAGVNAALALSGKPPLILRRSDGYIGVLIDDLVTKGTNEPYRMMTARAEYRLLLRQDNADLRLTHLGYRAGLAGRERYDRTETKRQAVACLSERLREYARNTDSLTALLARHGQAFRAGIRYRDLLKREGIRMMDVLALNPAWPSPDSAVSEQVEIEAKYEGYIKNQIEQVKRFEQMEATPLPWDLDYMAISALRLEARQKLTGLRPENIGRASRITGVSPADIAVLIVYLEKRRREGTV